MNNLAMFSNLVKPSQSSGLPSQGSAAQIQKPALSAPEMAAAGRLGDSVIAHLTPGEITIPPELQTPEIIDVLKKTFKEKGVDPSKFVAGSATASKNPQTGAEEHNFWSTFLPIALGIGGSLVAPGIGTALGSSLGAGTLGAIGGGVGTALGGIAGGQKPVDALITGGLSGLGSYGLGQLFAPGSEAVAQAAKEGASSGAATAASTGAEGLVGPTLTDATTSQIAPKTMDWARQGLASQPSFSNLYGMLPGQTNIGNVAGGALGGLLGQSMTSGNSTSGTGPQYPAGFNKPATPVDQLPSYQTLLGQNTYKGPLANFSNYNPMTLSPNSYNFYPVSPISSV